jgi:hypothetical protein
LAPLAKAQPHTVLAARHYVPPPQEVNAVLGATKPDTDPETVFRTRNEAQMGIGQRAGVSPVS